MMVLVSDLLIERDGLFRGLKLLRSRGHDVLVFHVLDDDEIDFPFNGPTRFEGLELPIHLACNPRALRQGYLDALGATWKRCGGVVPATTWITSSCAPASRWARPWRPF